MNVIQRYGDFEYKKNFDYEQEEKKLRDEANKK